VTYSNTQGRQLLQPTALSQAYLQLSSAPDKSLIGKTLINAGALGPGTYQCLIATDGMATLNVTLQCSAVSGSFAPTLYALRANGVATDTNDAGANFVAGTPETLTVTPLAGRRLCRLDFTVPGGGSITFAEGAKATPTAIAEYYGQ